MSHYEPDILAFDAISQLQFKGADDYRKHWEACLTMCQGPSFFEIHDLGITVNDGLAFVMPSTAAAERERTANKSLLDAHDRLLPQDQRKVEDRARTLSTPSCRAARRCSNPP